MLADTLKSLLQQTLSPHEYEIIVVDNASSDDTHAVVQSFLNDRQAGVKIHYVREDRLGLHFARHAGARVARGDILAYTDDDAIVDKGWLAGLLAGYDSPHVACVGGKILGQWTVEPPDWIRPYGPGWLSLLDLGDEVQKLDYEGIYGCNFSIRKSVLFEVGGFNPESFGAIWLGDGETGLLRKVLRAGYKIVYTPHAVVWHVIPPERMTLRYLKRRFANQGACDQYANYRVYRWPPVRLLHRSGRMALRALDRKLRALKYRPAKDDAYYAHELKAAYFWSISRYCLSLIYDGDFRQMVLREDWINEPVEH